MRTDDVVEIFGSKKKLAKAIGLTPSSVYQWGEEVPASRRQSVRMAMREKAALMEAEAAKLFHAAL